MRLQIPKHFVPVGMPDVNLAWTRVWRELDAMGLTCRRLSTCQVYLDWVSSSYGYQWYGDRNGDRHCGDIVLPRVSFSRWGDYFQGRPMTSLLDVLRHEYGHAYADVNRRRVETKKFEKAFGYPHEWWDDAEMEYDPDFHVTEYAATAPGEDFAEVFWLYLKHKGRLPGRLDTPPIRKKWEFVGSLSKFALESHDIPRKLKRHPTSIIVQKKSRAKTTHDGPDRDAIEQAYRKGVKAYITKRKRKLPSFIRRHFGWEGSFHRNQKAFGWDVPKSLINAVYSPLLMSAMLLEKAAGMAGWERVEAIFKNRWPGFTTAVKAETERLVYTELLELPWPGGESDEDYEVKNTLFETILEQPEIGDWIEETMTTIQMKAKTKGYRRNIDSALSQLDKDNRFAIELLTKIPLMKSGGAVEMGTAIATAMAHKTAVNSFWAGPMLGKIWYGTLGTASASFGLTLGWIAGAAVALAILSSCMGFVTDPIMSALGIQKRRLRAAIDALETDLNGTTDEETSEAFIDSLVEFLGMIYNVAQQVNEITIEEKEINSTKRYD